MKRIHFLAFLIIISSSQALMALPTQTCGTELNAPLDARIDSCYRADARPIKGKDYFVDNERFPSQLEVVSYISDRNYTSFFEKDSTTYGYTPDQEGFFIAYDKHNGFIYTNPFKTGTSALANLICADVTAQSKKNGIFVIGTNGTKKFNHFHLFSVANEFTLNHLAQTGLLMSLLPKAPKNKKERKHFEKDFSSYWTHKYGYSMFASTSNLTNANVLSVSYLNGRSARATDDFGRNENHASICVAALPINPNTSDSMIYTDTPKVNTPAPQRKTAPNPGDSVPQARNDRAK